MTVVIIIFLMVFPLFSSKSGADIYFTQAIERYMDGDLDGAIEKAESAFEIEKDNKKMKAFLLKLLIERASELYSNKLYEDALPYLKRAIKLAPDNADIKEMKKIAEEKISERTQPIIVEKGTSSAVVIAGMRDKQMMELIQSVQEQQGKIIEAYTKPQDVLRKLIEKSEEGRKKLYAILEKKDRTMEKIVESQKSMMTKTLIIVIGGGMLGAVVIILIIMMFASRRAARREEMMAQAQERILSMVMQQQQALIQGRTQLQLTHSPQKEGVITPREMLNDSNPRVRAKGIEVIEAELANADGSVAEKILDSFLDDRDNRVRANACKVLYKYNPDKAISKIKDMLESEDKWMKVSASWVLGEIKDKRGIDMLLKHIDTDYYHLKRMILKSLKKIVQTPEIDLDENKKQEIMNVIKEVALKEKWVI